ncbi:MAG TPA: YciI family protein [Rhodocyclaceae bacterium]|nr:YciI family protein [Rhodocyclaceae bacterium]
MLYVIYGEDYPNSLSARLAARPAHLARLQELHGQGRLILAGPCPAIDSPDPGPAGFSGSVIVAEFPSLEDAQAWAEADPYVAAGVYERVSVRPFKTVLPA